MRARMKFVIAAAATIVALILAAPVQAATAADDQYGAVLGEQSGGGGAQVLGAGTLPFTGLDLIALLGAGTGLAAAGMAVRRSARLRRTTG
jgi:hypothetical protein